jgi:hypothetical protein
MGLMSGIESRMVGNHVFKISEVGKRIARGTSESQAPNRFFEASPAAHYDRIYQSDVLSKRTSKKSGRSRGAKKRMNKTKKLHFLVILSDKYSLYVIRDR